MLLTRQIHKFSERRLGGITNTRATASEPFEIFPEIVFPFFLIFLFNSDQPLSMFSLHYYFAYTLPYLFAFSVGHNSRHRSFYATNNKTKTVCGPRKSIGGGIRRLKPLKIYPDVTANSTSRGNETLFFGRNLWDALYLRDFPRKFLQTSSV